MFITYITRLYVYYIYYKIICILHILQDYMYITYITRLYVYYIYYKIYVYYIYYKIICILQIILFFLKLNELRGHEGVLVRSHKFTLLSVYWSMTTLFVKIDKIILKGQNFKDNMETLKYQQLTTESGLLYFIMFKQVILNRNDRDNCVH